MMQDNKWQTAIADYLKKDEVSNKKIEETKPEDKRDAYKRRMMAMQQA
jgi:hypothetical protein